MISRSDDLEILLAVVDSNGFTAAADQLGMPVAKVSRAITRLESQLKTPLLNRTTRRVNLTEDGRLFVADIRASLGTLAVAEENLRLRQQSPSGRLRVDTANPFILHQIVPHVSAFRAAYPDVYLDLSASDQFVDLLEKRIDVAIRIGRLDDSSLHARTLGRSRLYLVASPDYLSHHGYPATREDLQGHSCIGFTAPASLNDWPVGDGIRITPSLSASGGEVVRQLCLGGNGIALLSNFMIADDVAAGRLIRVLPGQMQTPHPREQVSAVYYRNTALSSRIRVFLDFLAPRLTL